MSLSELAGKYGGSPSFHYSLLKEMGIRTRKKGGRPTRLQKQRSIEIARRASQGEKCCLLADEFGISQSTAYRACKREGLQPAARRNLRHIQQAIRIEIGTMLAEGKTQAEIADLMLVSPATVRRVAKAT